MAGKRLPHLFDLPIYPLRGIFSYLDATALYLLSKTCTYLRECIEDPMLWRYVDARSLPHTSEKYEYITKRLNEKTTHVFYSGGASLPSRFFTSNPFESLIVLSLENQTIISPKVLLKDFPPTLQELSLRNTLLKYNSDDFFQHSCNVMSKLRVLILDECSWLTSSFLLSVSKFDSLEIISVVRCQRVHLQTIPYLSIARYGCKKLKVLDCRFTGIGGEVLRTFFASESIQRMYFQSVNTSEVDYGRSLPKNGSFLEDICANADFVTITDGCLADYLLVLPSTATRDPVCESVLYKDPYPECTCGLEDPEEAERILNVELEDQDMIRYVSGEVTKFVCRKHNKDLEKLPNSVRNFFTANQREFAYEHDSDPDSDSDLSDSEEGKNCCLYGMGSKIIVASPDVTAPRGDSSPGPSNSPPMNIVVVKPRAEPTAEEEDNTRPPAEPAAGGSSSNEAAPPDADPQPGPSSSKAPEGPKKRTADTDAQAGPSKRSRPCCKTLNIIYSDGTIVRRRFDRSDDAQQEPGPSNRDRPPRALVIASVNLSRNHSPRNSGAAANANEAMQRTSAQLRDVRSRLTRNLNYAVRSDRPRGRRSVIVGLENNADVLNNADQNPPEPSGSNEPSGSGANGEASTSQARPENPARPPRVNPSRQLRVDPRNIRRLVNIMVQDYENRLDALPPSAIIGPAHNQYPPDRPLYRYRYAVNPSAKKKHVDLCRLSLRGYVKVTDMTLQYLRHLNLDLLDLTYTSVTKAGIEDFLVQNPDCRIIHPLYCVCKPRNPF